MSKPIKVQRFKDGRIFTSDMSGKDDACIIEIHFCTSYTQVVIQEKKEDKFVTYSLICDPSGSKPNIIDSIATGNDDEGIFL